jgi:alpha-tubulin suppressor-like RCC1 family protein
MRAAAMYLALLATLFIAACSQTTLTDAVDGPSSVSLTVRVDVSSFSAIDQVVVEVAGPGIATPLVFNLTITDGVASGTITVPTGSQRTITVTAFDAAGIATHRGSVVVDIVEGTNPVASVTLIGLQGDQPIEAHIGTIIVSVDPNADTLNVGDTLRLSATVVDGANDTLDVQVRWATLNPALAWVDTAGLVKALGFGEVTIVATYAGVGAAANLLIKGEFVAISAGGNPEDSHTCALTGAGEAFCWGKGSRFGQLGSGSMANSPTPVAVATSELFSAIDAGGFHTCGTTTGGAIYCWGYNTYGQLGDGTRTSRSSPVAYTGGVDIQSVTVGGWTTCGDDTGGSWHCWGWGRLGERGDGVLTEVQLTPVAVQGGRTFDLVEIGAYHTCGVTGSGQAYCWGNNGQGQLGTDVATGETCSEGPCASIPLAVQGGLTFTFVEPGGVWAFREHTCGLAPNGSAYCWGRNDFGQLGDGTTTDASTPTAVSGGLSFTSLSTHGEFACGLIANGQAYCWGHNDFGQLGNGTTTDSPVPVAVSGGLTFISIDAGAYQRLRPHVGSASVLLGSEQRWAARKRIGHGQSRAGAGDESRTMTVSCCPDHLQRSSSQ